MTTATICRNVVKIEMEESILGQILYNPDTVSDVADLNPAVFSISSHQVIFSAIQEVVKEGLSPDLLMVSNKLQDNGKLKDLPGNRMTLINLIDRRGVINNSKQYADALVKNYERSIAISELKKIGELAETEDVDKAIALAKEKIANLEGKRSGNTKVARAASRKSSFQVVMQGVTEIMNNYEDNPAQLEWELAMLAKDIGVSKSEVKLMYHNLQNPPKKVRKRSLKEFAAEGTAEREWIIGGYIPKGTTICMFADGGVGKTLLAYDIAKAIATGNHWNGYPTKQGKVLLVQTDEPEIDTRDRLDINGFIQEAPEGSASIVSDWQFCQMRHLKKIVEQDRPDFVVIDSLTSANRFDADSEKDASYAAVLYDLRDIANEFGCTFMVLHHENKGGSARGTTAIFNNVSEVWRLRKAKKSEGENLLPTQRILEFCKSRASIFGNIKIELDPENYSWQHQGEVGIEELSGAKQPLSVRLLSYLEANRGARFEPEELTHEFIGKSKDAIRKALERHRKQGLIFAEERVKQRESGPVRYKVYYSPLLSPACPGSNVQVANTEEIPTDKALSEKPNLDTLNLDTPGSALKAGQIVTINAGSKMFDGKKAVVVGPCIEESEKGKYHVKLQTNGDYNGYDGYYLPEFLVW